MAKGKFERAAAPAHRIVPEKKPTEQQEQRRRREPREPAEPGKQTLQTPQRGRRERIPSPQPEKSAVRSEPPRQAAPAEPPKAGGKGKRVWDIVKNVAVGLITLLAAGMMIFTIISVTMFDQAERSLLGFKTFIVLSDSMSATDFDAGDVVLVRPVDPTTLQPGDIIAFTSQNSANYGQTVTHKIRQKTTDVNGDPAFVTYGTTTDVDDETVVPYSHILGKYQFSLPKVGYFFQFLRTGPGYILFILVPFGLLIAYQGIQSVRLFRQGKKEEMDKLEAERAQVAAEREETRRMLEELRRMQNQMTRPPDAQA